ncbi:hypothetical protein Avbf_11246 [Armadillidium vulgare]|nr:hypothetical protein Avbf_11246 [Armadillidium vulgare]
MKVLSFFFLSSVVFQSEFAEPDLFNNLYLYNSICFHRLQILQQECLPINALTQQTCSLNCN